MHVHIASSQVIFTRILSHAKHLIKITKPNKIRSICLQIQCTKKCSLFIVCIFICLHSNSKNVNLWWEIIVFGAERVRNCLTVAQLIKKRVNFYRRFCTVTGILFAMSAFNLQKKQQKSKDLLVHAYTHSHSYWIRIEGAKRNALSNPILSWISYNHVSFHSIPFNFSRKMLFGLKV